MWKDVWGGGKALEGAAPCMAGWPLLFAWKPTVSSSITEFVKFQEDFVDPPEKASEPWPSLHTDA